MEKQIQKETWKILVHGMVQGVGYRPFVARQAELSEIGGTVCNAGGIVHITATAAPETLHSFVQCLQTRMPAGARVDRVEYEKTQDLDTDHFAIIESEQESGETESGGKPLLPPDLSICPACRRELADRGNRRYRHPFISCVACGPRYSIIESLPYDRENTTMADFPMCGKCTEEYTGRDNRRRHAQTIACHDCGPELSYGEMPAARLSRDGDAYQKAVALLKKGGILAVRDIGGYHLACLPFAAETIRALRLIKGREKKPFAVMFPETEQVREYCILQDQEQLLLESAARPIVLLRARYGDGPKLDPGVCTGSPDIGAMLPCNPLQVMLLQDCGPLVMTSANRSGEPMLIEEDQMLDWMQAALLTAGFRECQVPLGILSHNRRILTPLDDSVTRVVRGRVQIFRRARGYVPEPVLLAEPLQQEVFAAGGDLKAAFAYGAGKRVYLSQHMGDLENAAVMREYEKQLVRMRNLFGFCPKQFAADAHPQYLSGGRAGYEALHTGEGAYLQKFQHHRAHVASVLAEQQLDGAAVGLAFDGTGYAENGEIWGSEFFVLQDSRLIRKASLAPVRLIGGNEGARNAETILYGYLAAHGLHRELKKREMSWLDSRKAEILYAAILHRINTVTSTSMGRLFDAVSALLCICGYNGYEGQAAIELEQAAARSQNPYPLRIVTSEQDGFLTGDTKLLFTTLLDAMQEGIPVPDLARGFILAVAAFSCETADRLADEAGTDTIVLSGGTFQNRILLEAVIDGLESRKRKVWINEQVPPGDGGISLGQVWLTHLAGKKHPGEIIK